MSAQVSLGWNNTELTAGAKRAENIVKHSAAQMEGALKGVAAIDLGRLAGIGIAGYGFSQLASGIAEATLKADDNRQAMLAVEGSLNGVNERLTTLRDIARSPGLGFSQVVEADVKLRSVGMSAAESGRAIQEVGNALALVGKGKADLDGVLLALTQIVSKGKISAEEINQIAERVPQIRTILKGAFGTADSEQLQKLGLNVDEFIRRTIDGFSKLPRAIGGLRNSWENLGDTVQQVAASMGDAIVPELIPFMEKLSQTLSDNQENIAASSRTLVNLGRVLTGWGGDISDVAGKAAKGWQLMLIEILHLTTGMDRSLPHFNDQVNATRRLANDQKLAAINAAGLARQQRELEIATQRTADAQRRAADEADRYNRTLVQAAATRAQALTSLQDQLRAESAKTRDLLINDDQRLIDAKEKLVTIDKQLNATAGQKGSEEIVTRLYIEREKSMQTILELQKKIGEQQRRDAEDAARDAAQQAAPMPGALGVPAAQVNAAATRANGGTPISPRSFSASSGGMSAFDRLQQGTSAFDRLQQGTSAFQRLQASTSAFDRLQQRGRDPLMPTPAANATPGGGTSRDLIQVIQTLPDGIARSLLGE